MKQENLKVIAAGAKSSFWEALKEELLTLKSEAVEALIITPPEKIGEITEFQQIARLVDRLCALVDNAREELEMTENTGG